MGSPTDEELMEHFCRGDRPAFDALFERYGSPVHGFLVRMVHEPALAEDLLQMTWLSVVRSRDRFERGMAFRPWLMTIAGNAARDALRKGRYARALARDHGAAQPESFTPVHSDPGMRKRIDAALEAVPAQYREVVILHKVEGWSFEEISTALEITSTAARIRAHRGYQLLRELLGDLEGVS